MNTYLVSAKRLLIKGNIEQASENLVLVQSLIERVHKLSLSLSILVNPHKPNLGSKA